MILLKTYTGRRVNFEDVLFYTVENDKIRFIVTPQEGRKFGDNDSQGEIKNSSEALRLFRESSKRIEKIETVDDRNIKVTYKNGLEVKFKNELQPKLQKMQEEQYHYDNDGVSLVEGKNYRRHNGTTSRWVGVAIFAGLGLLALGQIPVVKDTLAGLVGMYCKDDYSAYTKDLRSTGNKDTDTLGSTLFGIIKSNRLVTLATGFDNKSTILDYDENTVREGVALLNNETPLSMEGISKEDYAQKAAELAQFWVSISLAALNPSNPVVINPADYARDPDVKALINNSFAVTRNQMDEKRGLPATVSFLPSVTESAKLAHPFSSNTERFVIYQNQTLGSNIPTDGTKNVENYIIFTLFAVGNENLDKTSYTYEGSYNGENEKWVYVKWVNLAPTGVGKGHYSWEAELQPDDDILFIEYNATGKKTGKKYTEQEMEAAAEKDPNMKKEGFAIDTERLREAYLYEIEYPELGDTVKIK